MLETITPRTEANNQRLHIARLLYWKLPEHVNPQRRKADEPLPGAGGGEAGRLQEEGDGGGRGERGFFLG